ncbi:MAG: hypothetical protein ACHQ16_08155, partial [Candidatus Lutacidiplasmatales archaeon]
LLMLGTSGPSQAGVQTFPTPDPALVGAVRRAADIVLAPAPASPLSILSAARAGAAPIVGRTIVFPLAAPKGAIRRPEVDDAGSFASDLAELFADLALRRKLSEAARSYADGYAPSKIASQFATLIRGS